MDLEGVVWSMAQHEKSKNFLFGSIVQVQTFFSFSLVWYALMFTF
jgi:hypothetical protein